jgi:Mor family transcriptional regulator
VTFSQTEILEEFVSSANVPERYCSYDEDKPLLSYRHGLGLYDPSPADAFLRADEDERARLRAIPRVIPKDPLPEREQPTEPMSFERAQEMRRYKGTASYRELARRFRCCRNVAMMTLQGRIWKKPLPPPKAPPAIRREVLALFREGVNVNQISAIYNLSTRYVYKICKGVPRDAKV